MIVAGRGIDRDKGNDLAVDLYIDLINTVAQILIVMRRDTVIFQQTLFKPGYVPRGVIAAVGIPQPRRGRPMVYDSVFRVKFRGFRRF